MKATNTLSNFWSNLSVSKKLYAVVGVMAVLIAVELFTLFFVMNVLSAVRAFVGGEGLWSKAQKDAVFEIQNYVASSDETHYKKFLQHMEVPLGDHRARLELEKPGNINLQAVTEGFIAGRNHPEDIPSMIKLITRFHKISYLENAIVAWRDADNGVLKLRNVAEQIHSQISESKKRFSSYEVRQLTGILTEINNELTKQEDKFSFTLGEASRWIEGQLAWILLITALTVEGTGLFLTVHFTRVMSRTLLELTEAATVIGMGDFTHSIPVRTGDELGQLANSLNRTAANLRAMRLEQKQAEEANQIKSLFLANMSHEIRTPLGAILGFVELLGDPNISKDEHKRFHGIVKRTGATLATIINDILDISKVEAGKLEINKTVFSLKTLLNDLQQLLTLRCEAKGIYLEFKLIGEMPDTIFSDATRLRQILLNVIGNAIKFTNKGGIEVRYWLQKKELIFSISDTGIGISSAEIDKLFRPFSQVDLSIRKIHGGTGLGLILSRRLAELLNGNVTLERSVPGAGSTFLLRIALENSPKPAELSSMWLNKPQATSAQRIDGKRILLVDDAADNQLLIQQFLEKSGAHVTVVANGLEAIQIAEKENFDLVLMDMQMPVMDGYTATQLLRGKGYKTPILALTAHAMKEDLEKCYKSGCDGVLTKPVERSHLVNTVHLFCAK